MVDDLLCGSECGHKAVTLNTFLNTQGKKNFTCPELKVHGHKMATVFKNKYLGDILSSTNDATLKERKAEAIGCLNKIISILDTISFGHHYFNTSLAAKGALANRLQRRTACKIQNGRQGAPKWQRGSGKVSTPRFLGVPVNFR